MSTTRETELAKRLRRKAVILMCVALPLWFVVNAPDNPTLSGRWWAQVAAGTVLVMVFLAAWSDLRYARQVLRPDAKEGA